MKKLSVLFNSLFILGTLTLSAQSKKNVNEDCQSDDDCRSGKCLVLRAGGKKCGTCSQDQLRNYTEQIDKWCKGSNATFTSYADLKAYFGSGRPISLIEVNKRMEICKACLRARQEREQACWDGGDPNHKGEIDKMKDAINYLEGVENEARRNGNGFTCDEDKFNRMNDSKENYCRGLKELFERYGLNDGKEVNCSEISSLIDKCNYCKKVIEDMINDCYRTGAPDKLRRELEDMRDMEKIARETQNTKKSKNLCK